MEILVLIKGGFMRTAKEKSAPVKTRKAKKPATRDFTDEEDLAESKNLTRDKGNYLKIQENERAPIYLLDSKYSDGFEHWFPMGDGSTVRIPCAGGAEGEGFAPDECPACKIAQETYNEAKRLASAGKAGAAKSTKQKANQIRAKYALYFLAAKGERNVIRLKGKDKQYKVEFDNAQVGLLSLTKAQRDNLQACKTKYEYIQSGKDLFNRYIYFDKQKRGEDEYATIEFIPAPKPTPKPDVEIPEDVEDLDSKFEVDMSELKKTVKAYLAGSVDDDDDDSGVEMEDEEESEEEEDSIDELDSDDVEEDNDTEEEEEEEETPRKKKGAPSTKRKAKPEPEDEETEEDTDDASSDDDDDFLGEITDDFEDDEPDEKQARKAKTTKPGVSSKKTVVGKKGPSAAQMAEPKKRGRPSSGVPPMPASAKKKLTKGGR